MRFRTIASLITLLGSFLFLACPGSNRGSESVDLSGSGASFPAPLYQKWASEYSKAHPNVRVDYQSSGSGNGVQQTRNRTIDFGATDAPRTDEQLKEMPAPVLHLPATAGAVAMVYNLAGIEKGLKLAPDILADIYLGRITKWNDPRIASLNSERNLPDQNIAPVYRSDGSGTTFIFTSFLSAVSSEWQTKVGQGMAVNWPAGQGARGNEGVAAAVRQTPGTIGYVELAYAETNNMAYAAIKNPAGNFVLPSLETTKAALAAVVPQMQQDVRQAAVNQPGADSYPIAGFTYILLYQDQPNAAKGKALTDFLWWAIHEGQKYAADLHYVPLPESVVKINEDLIKSITLQGQPQPPRE